MGNKSAGEGVSAGNESAPGRSQRGEGASARKGPARGKISTGKEPARGKSQRGKRVSLGRESAWEKSHGGGKVNNNVFDSFSIKADCFVQNSNGSAVVFAVGRVMQSLCLGEMR